MALAKTMWNIHFSPKLAWGIPVLESLVLRGVDFVSLFFQKIE